MREQILRSGAVWLLLVIVAMLFAARHIQAR